MDKYSHRRHLLRELIDQRFEGTLARFADETGIPASYVSRLLYAPEKAGAKNMGEGTVEKIESALALPGYFSRSGDGATSPAGARLKDSDWADLTAAEWELVTCYRRANEKGKRALLATARALKGEGD